MRIRRLVEGDESLAAAMVATLSAVFDEDTTSAPLGEAYLRRLLNRRDFFAVAAIDGDAVVGGITGHVLPMTRSESAEMFVYDLAVRTDRQRQGIGRALVETLRVLAAAEGIATTFIPVDNEDAEALEFYRAIGGEASPVTLFVFEGG